MGKTTEIAACISIKSWMERVDIRRPHKFQSGNYVFLILIHSSGVVFIHRISLASVSERSSILTITYAASFAQYLLHIIICAVSFTQYHLHYTVRSIIYMVSFTQYICTVSLSSNICTVSFTQHHSQTL